MARLCKRQAFGRADNALTRKCEVSVPVSRFGFGTYATFWALRGLPRGRDNAPNSLLGS